MSNKKRNNKYFGLLVDGIMYTILLLQMIYVFVGNIAHEWLGIGFFACLLIHVYLKRYWFRSMLRRKAPLFSARRFADLMIVLLLASIVILMASSIDVSRTLFPNIKFWGSSDFHRLMGTLVLTFSVIHGGMHGYFHAKRKKLAALLIAVCAIAVFCLGMYLVPYLNRHFRTVEVDYQAAVHGEAIEWQQGKTLAVFFTRVGNTDFEANVDAVSGASLLLADGELMGNTQLMADMLQDLIGCDKAAITVTGEKYPSSYSETCVVAGKEMKQSLYPDIEPIDVTEYDTILLVYPIWWFTLPRPVATFLTQNDFTGKTVCLIATQGSEGYGSSSKDIQELIPGAEVKEVISVYCDDIPAAREMLAEALGR